MKSGNLKHSILSIKNELVKSHRVFSQSLLLQVSSTESYIFYVKSQQKPFLFVSSSTTSECLKDWRIHGFLNRTMEKAIKVNKVEKLRQKYFETGSTSPYELQCLRWCMFAWWFNRFQVRLLSKCCFGNQNILVFTLPFFGKRS